MMPLHARFLSSRRSSFSTRIQNAPPAPRQQSGSATAYSQAMAEFQAGDFAKAATDLEALRRARRSHARKSSRFFTRSAPLISMPAITRRRSPRSKIIRRNFRKGAHAGDAAFAIAQSKLLSKNYKEAAAQMAALENDPHLREQALIFEAEAYKASGQDRRRDPRA